MTSNNTVAPRSTASRKQWRKAVGALVLPASLLMCVEDGVAVEVPAAGSPIQIQTNGPSAPLGNGDWYTSSSQGQGSHYLALYVPASWPSSEPIHIDIFSPEMNCNSGLDEVNPDNLRSDTEFELYDPAGTAAYMPFATPGPGGTGTLGAQTYSPIEDSPTTNSGCTNQPNEAWIRAFTLPAGTAPGTYLLRSASIPSPGQTSSDDQNNWSVRFGLDNDGDPTNSPPSNTDDPDGVTGTGDELDIGVVQLAYQHNAGGTQCFDGYRLIADASQASVRFDNFDFDTNGSITYTAPDGSERIGTISGNGQWNNGTASVRGGDVYTDGGVGGPVAGLWSAEVCFSSNNQVIFEMNSGGVFFGTPPTLPEIVLDKDDGQVFVEEGDTLVYTIEFTNNGDGAAINTQLTDPLPPALEYVSCAINAPYNGTGSQCSESGGTVTFDLVNTTIGTSTIPAGSTGSVTVTATVAPGAGASASFTNTATLAYDQANLLAEYSVSADDINTAADPLIKAVDTTVTAPGAPLTYTLSTNYFGAALLSNVVVSDATPTDTTYIGGSAAPAANSAPAGGGTGAISWDLGSNSADVPGNSSGGFAVVTPGNAAVNDEDGTLPGGSPLTISSFNAGTGTDLLVVGVSFEDTNGTVASISYAGQSIPLQNSFQHNRDEYRAEIWYLVNPPATGDIEVRFSEGVDSGIVVGATSFSGVDTSSPIFGLSVNDDRSSTASTSIDVPANGRAFATVVSVRQGQHTLGAGQQSHWLNVRGDEIRGSGSSELNSGPLEAAIDMSWTLSGSNREWAILAIAINPRPLADLSTTLSTDRTLVNSGESFTLTMELDSDTADTSVVPENPGTLANQTLTGGVTSVSCSSPSPASGQSISAGMTLTYTWTCTPVATSPGSVAFTLGASGTAETYPDATSNSVLVTPPLSFQVEVDGALTTPSFIENTGTITDSNVFVGGEDSNTVVTNILPTAATIGDVELSAQGVDSVIGALIAQGAAEALLRGYDPQQASVLAGDSGAIGRALEAHLDPDGDGQVAVLRWDTLEERGTIGFYVQRKDGLGVWGTLNGGGMLPGLIDAPLGGEYWLVDPSAELGTEYLYRLVEQEAWGTQRDHGPYRLRLD